MKTINYNSLVAANDLASIYELPTMAARIRKLDSIGLTKYQISKVLNIKYQWVRNVLITPLKSQ